MAVSWKAEGSEILDPFLTLTFVRICVAPLSPEASWSSGESSEPEDF